MKHLAILLVFLCTVSTLHAEDWMRRLPDDAYVAAVSIPGAHDAATGDGFSGFLGMFGNRYARTQDLNMSQQWRAGVRAFDLRPSVYKEYIQIHHGVVPTKMRFDRALQLLCDSLQTHPSEFVIIHLLHAADGDKVKGVYDERIQQLLRESRFKRFLVDYRPDLRVSDMRGKILILSRDHYGDAPIGGIFRGWTGGLNWQRQTAGILVGPHGVRGRFYVQDYSSTHHAGGVASKVKAITQMLDSSTRINYTDPQDIVWVLNFASAYSKVENLFGRRISLSNGYRDNATHTHKAFLDYLSTHSAGPTGIILMDYAGVDDSNGYPTRGAELVQAIIRNNFRYMTPKE